MFIFIYLTNKLYSNLTLGSTIKQKKLEYDNVFVNKLMKLTFKFEAFHLFWNSKKIKLFQLSERVYFISLYFIKIK